MFETEIIMHCAVGNRCRAHLSNSDGNRGETRENSLRGPIASIGTNPASKVTFFKENLHVHTSRKIYELVWISIEVTTRYYT